jgi:hypothetical protein
MSIDILLSRPHRVRSAETRPEPVETAGGNVEVNAKAEEINRAISLSEWLISK